MAQVSDAPAVQGVYQALALGDVTAAVAAAEDALRQAPQDPEVNEVMADLAFGVLDDYARADRHYQLAYSRHRRSGDSAAAARLAIKLVHVTEADGRLPLMRGWLSRARRLVEEARPCLEEGYLCVALLGCDVADVNELERLAARAVEVARQYGDTDLEIRALAERGLALVSLGRIDEGVELLEEAAAAVLGGEVQDFGANGLTCCSVVSGFERLGDVERLVRFAEALDERAARLFRGFRTPILLMHCRLAYGGLLGEAGRWHEAEIQLLQALDTSRCVGHRAATIARLATVRIHQNRLDDAAELLRGWEDRIEASGALARLHDARGELELAASTLRVTLRDRGTDILSSAPLWAHLADVEARLGKPEAAAQAAAEIERIAELAPSPLHRAQALLARARATAAAGEDAEPALVEALRTLSGVNRPLLHGAIHLELARARQTRAPAEAVIEARTAHAIYERLDAKRDLERTAALLRELGQRVRPPERAGQEPADLLSRRELEILPLVAEGLSNAEIAARIFVSPKTVEHHVSAILGKLGVRKRAEAAAWAASHLGTL